MKLCSIDIYTFKRRRLPGRIAHNGERYTCVHPSDWLVVQISAVARGFVYEPDALKAVRQVCPRRWHWLSILKLIWVSQMGARGLVRDRQLRAKP